MKINWSNLGALVVFAAVMTLVVPLVLTPFGVPDDTIRLVTIVIAFFMGLFSPPIFKK